MSRRRSSQGYAMPAALLVMVLAATFVLVVVGAVRSLQAVERSDAAGWRADAVAGRAVGATTGALRWRPGTDTGALRRDDPSAREWWRASWAPAPAVAGVVWPRLRATVSAASGGARRDDALTIEMRAEPWATGVTCSGDADIQAPLEVAGSGLYVGGCLRGRENVEFVGGPSSVTPSGDPADGVRGDVFPAAAVHGGAGIFAGGLEIHSSAGAGPYAQDTDDHAGVAVPQAWLTSPSAEFLVAASTMAASPGNTLDGARLSLDQLGVRPGADAQGGTCLVLPEVDEVTIDGSAPPEAGRLLLIVCGDAVLGEPGETVAFSGSLVVCGHLHVRSDLRLEGCLHAQSVTIDAPTHIRVAPDWRQHPLAGAAIPSVIEHGS